MNSGLSRALDELAGDRSTLRSGIVVRFDSSRLTVRVGESEQSDFPYLQSYAPALGDTVLLQQYGSTWLCIGTPAGMPPTTGDEPGIDQNPIANPSFEESSTGVFPAGWAVYHDPLTTATTTITTEAPPDIPPVDGSKACQVKSTVTPGAGVVFSNDYLYSSPIPVQAGQRWSADAMMAGYRANPPDGWVAYAGVLLSWYDEQADVYPNTVATNSLSMFALAPLTLPWVRVQPPGVGGGIEVPSGATWMRVILLTNFVVNKAALVEPLAASYFNIYWDRVAARRVS